MSARLLLTLCLTGLLSLGAAAQTGAIDPTFTPGAGATGPNDLVACLQQDAQGRMLVGGWFHTFSGHTHGGLVRLEADGSLDTTFDRGAGFNTIVWCMDQAPDGGVYCGGFFTSHAGTHVPGIARLTVEGALDTTFHPAIDGTVLALVALPDGSVLAGGELSDPLGSALPSVVHLLANGDLDPGFNYASQLSAECLTRQPDGRLLVGGVCEACDGSGSHLSVVRVLDDGSIDPSFHTEGLIDEGEVQRIVLLAGGRMLICGDMLMAGTSYTTVLARLNSDGSLDPTFATAASPSTDPPPGTPGVDPTVLCWSIALLPDSGIIGVGQFDSIDGAPHPHVVKFLGSGLVDDAFDVGSGTDANTLAVMTDALGRITIGGSFSSYQGTACGRITRLASGCTPTLWYADADEDRHGDPLTHVLACVAPDGWVDAGDDCDDNDPNNYPNGPCDDGDPFTHGDRWGTDCVCAGHAAKLDVSMQLEGALAGGLGRDDLRANGLLPTTEPYSAMGYTFTQGVGLTVAPARLQVTGSAAIVDWVIVELRDPGTPATIVASRPALLQRDGRVVEVSGDTLTFAVAAGPYHVAVRHRNHLGAMSAAPIGLGTAIARAHFTDPAFATYGTSARINMSGIMALWCGDVNFDGRVAYTGALNDRDPLLIRVGSTTPNNTATGYFREDTDLDGHVSYTGGSNDRDIILVNVGSTVPTNVRVAQLP